MLGVGAMSVAADTSVLVVSSTAVGNGTGTSVCASQSTQVQLNGSNVVNRTDGACTP
jgi:hypothetical protein